MLNAISVPTACPIERTKNGESGSGLVFYARGGRCAPRAAATQLRLQSQMLPRGRLTNRLDTLQTRSRIARRMCRIDAEEGTHGRQVRSRRARQAASNSYGNEVIDDPIARRARGAAIRRRPKRQFERGLPSARVACARQVVAGLASRYQAIGATVGPAGGAQDVAATLPVFGGDRRRVRNAEALAFAGDAVSHRLTQLRRDSAKPCQCGT